MSSRTGPRSLTAPLSGGSDGASVEVSTTRVPEAASPAQFTPTADDAQHVLEHGPMDQDKGWILVRGARTHNLRDVDVAIPRGRFVVVSGVSGSGKSSLAFDTLYAEGQRRYVESLSSYARQFLGMMKKADCDGIEGLSPAISIDQKSGTHNPRSTVGTVTEMLDHLRLLWARIGQPHCPTCGRAVARRTVQEIVDDIMWRFEDHAIAVWSPAVRERKGTFVDLFAGLVEQGHTEGRVDGRDTTFSSPPTLERNHRHDIDVRIDRLRMRRRGRQRITEAVEEALRLGGGALAAESLEEDGAELRGGAGPGTTIAYSEEFACPEHGAFLPEMSPRIFSFNNPLGACPECQGLGVQRSFSLDLVIDVDKGLLDGSVRPFQSSVNRSWYVGMLRNVAQHYGISTKGMWSDLSEDEMDIILYGSGSTVIEFVFSSDTGSRYEMRRPWEGIMLRLERQYTETTSDNNRSRLASYMVDEPCGACGGMKLNRAVRGVTVGGISLSELNQCSVREALAVIEVWRGESEAAGRMPSELAEKVTALDEKQSYIGREVLKEVHSRLSFLDSVGLEYLTLDRRANTLSGGESQRIRLATQIGSRLTGVMYVLDEPSIGLHPRDNDRLLETLRSLADLGNTLIVVEHDEETLRQADWLVDLGPGAGRRGGDVVANGPPEHVMAVEASITGAFLSGRRRIAVPPTRVTQVAKGRAKEPQLVIRGAAHNNLQEIDVSLPLGRMIAVTGVSGSGKSSLVSGILAPALQRHLHGAEATPGRHRAIEGIDLVHKAIIIDQGPIGRTPRSNPATYTKVFDPIRQLFAKTELARERGYKSGRFSFNVKGGRCEACQGAGSTKLEMNFLPDVWVTCDICKSRRYNRETLEVTWKGRTIHEVLEMTVAEAVHFFKHQPEIHRILETLDAVGLGYVHLGQPAPELSGGEAQRVKLAAELRRPPRQHTMYILDEPTTGLSLPDVEVLIGVLQRLRDKGHTVLIIEHHLDVVKCCDWVVDLGPDGGLGGGRIVATGTPEQVAAVPASATGRHLAPLLVLD